MVGDLKGYGTVLYYTDGITNILSLFHVSNKLHVQYNSRVDYNFVVWKDNGSA